MNNLNFEDHYRGCMGELRIGGILIPYYTTTELVNDTASVRFDNLFRSQSVNTSECIVCFEHECQNGGKCQQPEDEFECTCPKGYEDSLCGTNTNECLVNSCLNGECVDSIGKKHASEKYDQFVLNTSCFSGNYRIKYYPSAVVQFH